MIESNGVLVGHFANPQAILDSIPRAKYIRFKGKDLVLVPHKLDETLVLKNLGISAPSPILTQYDWTGRFTPMTHQYDTAAFLTLNKRCFCLNEMRTGKTSSALWAADYLKNIGAIDEVLVICPISVMGVWVREGFATTPHRSVEVLTGTKAKRIRLLETKADIKVINFDGLVSIQKEVAKYYANKRVVIIVDEAATYRTYGTDRYKALRTIITPRVWLWMMTGTPTPNAPTDAWALAKFVNPKSVPPSFKLFQETVMKQVGPYKWVPKVGSEQVAFNALQPAIRYLRKDCLDIPETTVIERSVDMSASQIKIYDDLKRKMRHEAEDITAANAAVRLLKLQQVFCGIVKNDLGIGVNVDNEARLDLTRELVEENGGKAIIFVPFKLSMRQLEDYLGKFWRVAVVNGEVNKNKRQEIFDGFQRYNTIDVLIAHPGTTAHGLDLSASSTIIWFAPTFSLELYEQANARIQGPNQTEPCGIFHIGCHPLEWSIYEAVSNKLTVSEALLSLYNKYVEDA
jgi:SNF2 family DNA or RNA helicase